MLSAPCRQDCRSTHGAKAAGCEGSHANQADASEADDDHNQDCSIKANGRWKAATADRLVLHWSAV